MGIIKAARANPLVEGAARAIQEGRNTYMVRFWDGWGTFKATGPIAGASEAIDAIEAQGWLLQNIAYSWADKKDRGVTVLVFRKK